MALVSSRRQKTSLAERDIRDLDVLSRLILGKAVCNDRQQTTKLFTCRERFIGILMHNNFVEPDLGPNFLQKLAVDNKCCHLQEMS